MWVQVRSIDGSKGTRRECLSKLTKVKELKERIAKHFDAEPCCQRLFYRGRQLEDKECLFHYDVGLNHTIQLMVRPAATLPLPPPSTITNNVVQNGSGNGNQSGVDSASKDNTVDMVESVDQDSAQEEQIGLYKVKDKVDARDVRMGAWFEAEVVKVTKEPPPTSNGASGSQHIPELCIYYHVKFDDYSEDEIMKLTAADVRPRASYKLQWDQLAPGSTLMVNYNLDRPRQRGFWYDAVITHKDDVKIEVFAKLVLNQYTDAQQEIKVIFTKEIFRIETRTQPKDDESPTDCVAREKKPDCDWCRDNPRRKCKHCACCVCGGKESPDKQILCDECNAAYHLWCLSPKVDSVPEEDDCYCPSCKNDSSEGIAPGEMRLSKKKANMVCKKSTSNRDWGKGMATVGRTKTCTIVPKSHFGPIPGVPVGTQWMFRIQCSESGVHRHSVAGIHGRAQEGAFSIVLSGGYKDDIDSGEEFTYSGSGGRDLSGNKRTATAQSWDQQLTRMNRALAVNCDAPVDAMNGATAKDWKKGKPVRVVRNHKGGKNSTYAPGKGNRYDGIYKVVKYWPEKSKITGFIVWKYLLRRDDPSPAPWTKEGEKNTEKMGLTMQFPDGYLEAQAAKQAASSEEDREEEPKRGRKRKSVTITATPSSKQPRYELSKQQLALIRKDTANVKLWEEFLEEKGSVGLLQRIRDTFSCIVCQELVHEPITTVCSHNVCKNCLSRSFQAELYACPYCRHDLGKKYDISKHLNKSLQSALLDIFPGYTAGR